MADPARAKQFYQDILGLDVLMDMGWIATCGSKQTMTVQISFMTEGGSGARVPDLSIEVDDLDAVLARVKKAKIPWSMALRVSRGACVVSSYVTRSASS